MTGIPIKDWGGLLSAIQGLLSLANPPASQFYPFTYENKSVELSARVVTQALSLTDENEYEILLRNLGTASVSLYFANSSSDHAETLSLDNSGFYLEASKGNVFYRSGFTWLYAISEAPTKLGITVHSNKQNFSKGGSMSILLHVDFLLGTGTFFREGFSISHITIPNYHWKNFINASMESEQKISGHRIARLASFQPGETYSFKLELAGNIDWADDGRIRVYLLDTELCQYLAWELLAFSDGYNISNGPEHGYGQLLASRLKQWKFIKAEIPKEGGTFELAPLHSERLLFFDVKRQSHWDMGVITDFDLATNTFTVGGY